MNQGLENFDKYKIDECQCVYLNDLIVILIIMFTACTCHFNSYM